MQKHKVLVELKMSQTTVIEMAQREGSYASDYKKDSLRTDTQQLLAEEDTRGTSGNCLLPNPCVLTRNSFCEPLFEMSDYVHKVRLDACSPLLTDTRLKGLRSPYRGADSVSELDLTWRQWCDKHK